MSGVPETGGHEGPAPGLAEVAERVYGRARRGRLVRGCLVSVFTVALLTLAAEVFLRVTDYRLRFFEEGANRAVQRWVELTTAGVFEEVPDPVRRYAMRPGAEGTAGRWTFRVSSHRTRGADFPREKPAAERRLLCLGDSFAFGLWCGDDETLVAQLARMASENEAARGSGLTWRGVNLGVPGYHTGQALRAFEQDGLALDPDVVLLYFNTNDIETEGFFYDGELGCLRRDFLPLPTRLRRLLWRSHLYGWIVSRHKNAIENRPAPHLDPGVPYAHVRADNQARTRASIARIAALCAERDVPLFFVNQPLMTYSGDTRRPDWNVLPLVEWAEAVRTELGIPGVNLLGWARGYADGVDRMAAAMADGSAEIPPPDFLLDQYIADEFVEAAVASARADVRSSGKTWESLTYGEVVNAIAPYVGEPPRALDFHLTAEGYAHIARIVYPHLQGAGLLP